MLETRVLDKINFSSLQNKVFGPFLEFMLSKTRVFDGISFLVFKYRYLERVYFVMLSESQTQIG